MLEWIQTFSVEYMSVMIINFQKGHGAYKLLTVQKYIGETTARAIASRSKE